MKYLSVLLLFMAFGLSCNKSKIGYTTPVVNPTNTYDNRAVGASAKDLLTANIFKAVNVEIHYVKGYKLPDSAINEMTSFLERYCNKPNGIHIIEREIPMQGSELIVNNLNAIEKTYRTKYDDTGVEKPRIDTIGIYIFVSEGHYTDRSVLGIAFKNTSISLFGGTIEQNSGGLTQPSYARVAATVLKHELGHLLGLVNLGTAMQTDHQDPSHEKHCNNPQCLMYYKVQTTDVLNVLTGGNIPQLDANCEADLRANGGK